MGDLLTSMYYKGGGESASFFTAKPGQRFADWETSKHKVDIVPTSSLIDTLQADQVAENP